MKMLPVILLSIAVLGCKIGDSSSSFPTPITEAKAETTDTFVKSLTITKRSNQARDGVVIASCNVDETAVGGGCSCTGSATNNEDGELFACEPVGKLGFGGACYIQDAYQVAVPVKATVVCLKESAGTAVTGRSLPSDYAYNAIVAEEESKFRQLIEDRRVLGR